MCTLMHFNTHTHTNGYADWHKVYGTVVDKADHLYRLAGGEYDDDEFETHPDRYGSIFADKVSIKPHTHTHTHTHTR